MKTMKIGNLEAIAFHLEQGKDNGGITREALAEFLRGVADELERMSSTDGFTGPSEVDPDKKPTIEYPLGPPRSCGRCGRVYCCCMYEPYPISNK